MNYGLATLGSEPHLNLVSGTQIPYNVFEDEGGQTPDQYFSGWLQREDRVPLVTRTVVWVEILRNMAETLRFLHWGKAFVPNASPYHGFVMDPHQGGRIRFNEFENMVLVDNEFLNKAALGDVFLGSFAAPELKKLKSKIPVADAVRADIFGLAASMASLYSARIVARGDHRISGTPGFRAYHDPIQRFIERNTDPNPGKRMASMAEVMAWCDQFLARANGEVPVPMIVMEAPEITVVNRGQR
jgi:hypothetical protein